MLDKMQGLVNRLDFEGCIEAMGRLEQEDFNADLELLLSERMELLDADRFIKWCEDQ